MHTTNQSKKQGFTLIEVVLVLAIAGLIFLIVFLALPALQRSQRDTQRKNDLSRFMSQVTNYQSNNQGNLPTDWSGFVGNYLTNSGQTFNDPSTGSTYSVTASGTVPGSQPAFSEGTIRVYTSANCGGGWGVTGGAGGREIAALIFQEQGTFYCQSN